MTAYYVKNALKRIIHDKYLSLVNILGLAIGISCSILIFLFVHDELQFDKTFPYKDRLYRVYGNNFAGSERWVANQPNRLYEHIAREIPEIEKSTVLCLREYTVTHENSLSEENFAFTDSSVFDITGWKLLSGNPNYVLNEPMTVVISESAAKKLYGDMNPIGQKVRINRDIDLTITGIFRDVPTNTHIYADYLTSKLTRDSISSGEDHWGNFSSSIFVRLRPDANTQEVSNKITALWMKYSENEKSKVASTQFKLQPLEEIYLHSSFLHSDSLLRYGNYMVVVGFSIIGLLILIIACFNYLNLTIAQANERGKEVGIRKTTGASIPSLYSQFLIESAVFTFIALFISLFIIQLIFPWFNQFTGKHLALLNAFPPLLYFVGGIIAFIIACTGLYPAFVMSNFETISILKGKTNFWNTKKVRLQSFHQALSKSLVGAQFTISAILIICALFVQKQMNFIRNYDTGFDKSQIMVIQNTWDGKQEHRFKIMKDFCAGIPEIEMVTAGSNVPTDGFNNYGSPVLTTNPTANTSIGFINVDYDYLPSLDARFIQGRNFDKRLASDSSAVIISESCLKQLGTKDALGQTIDGLWDGRKRIIIGVIKDIHYTDLHSETYPLLFMVNHQWMTNSTRLLFKFKTEHYAQIKLQLEKKWKELCPEELFTYFFLEEKFEENYRKDSYTAFLMNAFTLLSVLLCMMGLTGLVAFSVQKRTKEIGIRKVNGAHTSQVMALFNRSYIKWVAIAFLVACPIAWYAMHKWIENFAYKTTLSWWIFALAGIIALMIALVTVSWQSWRAATRNPVESLRYE